MADEQKGTVAIFRDADGAIVASCADFGEDCHEATTLQKAREIRANSRLQRKVISAYAAPQLVGVIEANSWGAEILADLVRYHDCAITIIPVYEEDC